MSQFRDLLSPSRLTYVVDIGANPIDGEPPYTPMLTESLCHVTGFEPQQDALVTLQKTCGPNERYLPYAVGDGGVHSLNICRSSGLTSLLTPDRVNLQLFDYLRTWADVIDHVPLQTRRLDDIGEIQHLDFLKIDIQGGELAVFQGGLSKLAECVAIQTEVSFVTLYENQPALGDVDLALRSLGFMPHCFAAVKNWAIAPYVVDGDPRRPLNQLLEADIVYVRDIARADAMTDEQLKHLALIAHHCYRSFDLASRCVMLLEDRRAVEAGSEQRYLEMLGAKEAVAESIAQPLGAGPSAPTDAPAHSRDVLLAAVERDPGDVGSVFSLAQAYFDSGDFLNARTWYLRRAELGGRDEEVYYSLLRVAESMARLDVPWPQVHDAYLKAWEFRPTRAEPLYAIALRYRLDGRYRLGYLFAKRAADIALPEQDTLVVRADVHAWRAADEQAICASWIGKHAEAFTLCRRLLASAELPDRERQRITRNRDFSVPAMLEAASSYPEGLVDNLIAGPRGAEVTVSVVAGPDLSVTEQTLNSFLHCCTDVSRVGRFLVIDAGLSAQDRATLGQRYGFVEFADPHTELAPIGTRFWLHLGQGWQFFAPEDYITRLTAVLDTEPQVFQVGINFTDATTLTSASAAEQTARRTPDGGRYVLTDVAANGPAMFDTTRLHQAGDVNATTTVPTITDLARHAATTGLHTATLDEILCTTV